MLLIVFALSGLFFLLNRAINTLVSTVLPIVLLLLFSVPIDYKHFGRITSPHLNLVLYNSGSSSLYGIEPPSYYLKNLVLNFNLAFPLAAFGVLLILVLSYMQSSGGSGLSQR